MFFISAASLQKGITHVIPQQRFEPYNMCKRDEHLWGHVNVAGCLSFHSTTEDLNVSCCLSLPSLRSINVFMCANQGENSDCYHVQRG